MLYARAGKEGNMWLLSHNFKYAMFPVNPLAKQPGTPSS